MKTKWYTVLFVLAAMSLLFNVSATKAEDLMSINIAAGSAIDHVTNFAALDLGIFEKYGLDANITVFDTGVQIVNALQSGQADVGTFGSVPMLTSVAKGIPLRLIAYNHGDANRKYYNDNQGLIASAASGIKEGDIASLAGKKVGLPIGSGAEPYFYGLIEAAGVEKKDVEVVNVGPPDLAITLQQGGVDAVAIWEAFVSTIVKEVDGAVLIIRGNSPGWFDPGTTVTSQQTIDNKREVLKRYLAAQAEIHQWVRQNPDEAAEIATRWVTGLQTDIAKSSIKAPVFDPRMSKLTYEGYEEITIPFLMSQGKIDKAFPATEVVRPEILIEVMNEYPQFYDDLEAIPEEYQLK